MIFRDKETPLSCIDWKYPLKNKVLKIDTMSSCIFLSSCRRPRISLSLLNSGQRKLLLRFLQKIQDRNNYSIK